MTGFIHINSCNIFSQIQLYGFNKELYHNMSEAQHKSQGIVGISLMVQIGETPNPELRIITSTFSKVLYRGKWRKSLIFFMTYLRWDYFNIVCVRWWNKSHSYKMNIDSMFWWTDSSSWFLEVHAHLLIFSSDYISRSVIRHPLDNINAASILHHVILNLNTYSTFYHITTI